MINDINNKDITKNDTIEGFRINRVSSLPKLNTIMYQLEHIKTGAKLIHLSNDDENNCFGVAFRTTPTDSTGVAHILEHTALCGSKFYPVRDPFFSMIKRSMKTFMNAFTASDWTMYPFSTQNRTDYFNLMRVYLDAAFFPLLSENSFKQEGHRLEFLEEGNTESPLTVQGIVYNEMKGAMSSQAHQMSQSMASALFPTITYRYNSGGEPSEILKLTHSQLLDFHRFHYHPSNSFFYTYGTFPLRDTLKLIQEKALLLFDRISVDTKVPPEKRFSSPKEFSFSYPLDKRDDDGEKVQIALGWLTCDIKEPLEVLSLHLINLILLGHAGAPLRKKLLESKLGKALADTTGFEDEISEPYFSVGLQGVSEKNIDKVETLILETLQEIQERGIRSEQIESAIHQLELNTREISGGHYPYSLNLLFRFFGTFVHGGDPLLSIDFDSTLEELNRKIASGNFLERQIKKYLIDNQHRVKVVLKPDHELEKKETLLLEKELDTLKSRLSPAEKEAIKEESKRLKAIQEKREDLSCLPSLRVSDIPKEISYIPPSQKGLDDLEVTFYDRKTNGIVYINWYFSLCGISDDERVLLPLLGYFLTNTGVDGLSYEELAVEQSRYTGGFSALPVAETIVTDSSTHNEYLLLSSKALYRNIENLFDLGQKIVAPRQFNEMDRIQTLIAQRTNSLVNSLVQAGHNYASSLANRQFGRISQIDEIYRGIHQVRFMKQLLSEGIEGIEKLLTPLRTLVTRLFRPEYLSTLVIGEKEIFGTAREQIRRFSTSFAPNSQRIPFQPPLNKPRSRENAFHVEYKNEGWLTTTPVSYIADSFKTATYTHDDSPKLLVLATLLKSCYLHREIREKGGAYGAMTSYNADEGIFTLLSYRDPHLSRTISVFTKVKRWLTEGSFTEQDVREAIIQTCSNMDTPTSPAGKAITEFSHERKKRDRKLREKFRAGVLSCTKENLIKMSDRYLNSQSSLVALTSEEIVKRDNPEMANRPLSLFPI